jgi:hypothetical protein
MNGNRKQLSTGVVPQTRDLHLLSELAVLRIFDRETARVVGRFGAIRRVNARLLQLVRAGLLRRFFVGSIAHGRKAVYTLSPKGAELVGAQLGGITRPAGRLVVGDAFVEHQSRINDIYVALKYQPLPDSVLLRRWITFRQSISDAIKLMPDGYFEIDSQGGVRPMFVEVDLGTEALKVWEQKTAQYLQLAVSGEFARRFREPQFRTLVVTSSERRQANIRSTVSKSTDKIFWFTTFNSINRDGFWSPIWLRPTGDQRLPLI